MNCLLTLQEMRSIQKNMDNEIPWYQKFMLKPSGLYKIVINSKALRMILIAA